MVPVHAMVMILDLPDLSLTLTITAGTGYMKLPGFLNVIFDIDLNLNFRCVYVKNYLQHIGYRSINIIIFWKLEPI